jgi:hypothetical protein
MEAYCPLIECGVSSVGVAGSASTYNVEHASMGKLEYELSLVYTATDFKVSCSNSYSANTVTENIINLEVHCPVASGCSNTDVGTFDWPRYALSASMGVLTWKEYMPASRHITHSPWQTLWNADGYPTADRNYHEFEMRAG